MTAVSISGEKFAESKRFCSFVIAKPCDVISTSTDILYSADKAGSLRQSYFGMIARFGDFRKGLASLYLYIFKFLVSMPNRDKNLTANAQGASTSTVNVRNNVHPLQRCTKRELINLIEGFSTAATTRDISYALALNAFLEWFTNEEKGLYSSDIRDSKLLHRLEAIRIATTSGTSKTSLL